MATTHRLSKTAEVAQKYAFSLSAAGRVTLLLGLACIVVIISQEMTNHNSSNSFVLILASVVVIGLGLLDVWLGRNYGERPPPKVAVVVLVCHALLVELVALADGLTYTSILYLTIPFPAFVMLGRRVGYSVSIGILLWLTAKFFIFKPDWLSNPTAVNSFALLFVSIALITIMAQVVQSERAGRHRTEMLLADLNESHKRLAEYADQVAELATVEERNRLARDIHDSLGHYLTVIGIQLEKARAIYDDDAVETLASIQNAKRMTDQALNDVRESVGTLREKKPTFVLYPALLRLVDNLKDSTFTVDLTIRGEEAYFTQHQLMSLYRAVQEGLTNIQKHAKAKQVSIEVNLSQDEAVLTLTDDGVGMTNLSPENEGLGLRGLRERLELISGRLTIDSTIGLGTTLYIRIPRLGVMI